LATLLACADGISARRYAPVGRFWVLERTSQPVGASTGSAASKASSAAPAAPAAAPKAGAGTSDGSPLPTKTSSSYQIEALARLVELPAVKVVSTGETWLSDANPELLNAWASGTAELQTDLLEVFPW
jgi:hypothetical protein